MIIKVPRGPIRPVIEALEENEILHGFVASVEDSAAYQLRRLREDGGEVVALDEYTYDEYYHGIDGSTWSLDHLFAEYFPGLHRASAFMTIWGSFERHMNELCDEVAKTAGYKVSVKDLAGRGLPRARAYLVKVAGLDGKWARAHWQELPDLQRIRNLFAHGDGHLDADHSAQRKYAEASPHIVMRGDVVGLEPTFLTHFLKLQREFLLSLQEAVVERFGDD